MEDKDPTSNEVAKMNKLEEFSLQLIQMCVGQSVEITSQDKELPGTPDFSIHSLRLAIFIDGEYWHDTRGKMTRTAIRYAASGEDEKASFWSKKSQDNKARDRVANAKLKKMGFKIVRLKEERLNGHDPLRYVSQAIGLALFPRKEKMTKGKG